MRRAAPAERPTGDRHQLPMAHATTKTPSRSIESQRPVRVSVACPRCGSEETDITCPDAPRSASLGSARPSARRDPELDCCQAQATCRVRATQLEYRPRGRPMLDSPGRSIPAEGHARHVPRGRPMIKAAPKSKYASQVLTGIDDDIGAERRHCAPRPRQGPITQRKEKCPPPRGARPVVSGQRARVCPGGLARCSR